MVEQTCFYPYQMNQNVIGVAVEIEGSEELKRC
jgi:hypothetical protein